MKLSPILLLSLIISAALASYDGELQLPDLKVTTTDADCSNWDTLKAKTQQDINRLTNFNANDAGIPKLTQYVQRGLALVKEACNLNQNFRSLSQTTLMQIQSSIESFSGMRVAFESLNQDLASSNADGELYNLAIGDKLKEVTALLVDTDVTELTSSSASICVNVIPKFQTLIKYLGFVQGEIKARYLDSYLPQRLDKIASVYATCAKPTTQTGTFTKVYYNTGHVMEQAQNSKRTDDLTVKFAQAFDYAPKVGIALLGLDINKDYPIISLDIQSVAVDSFVFRVTAEANVQVNQIQISYIATLSDQTGIYLGRHSITKGDADLAKTSVGTAGSSPRLYTRTIPPPSALKNPVAVAFLRSFNFGAVYNARLTVYNADPTSITYKTYEDTILNSAASTILFYSGDDATTTKAWAAITTNGPLAAELTGVKQENVKIDVNAYSGVPQIFYGIFHYDFFAKANHRLSQSLSDRGDDGKVVATIKNWADTRTYGLRDSVVMTCTSKLPCLAKK